MGQVFIAAAYMHERTNALMEVVMPRGPRVAQDVEAFCMAKALEDREAPAKEIREKVREWLEPLERPTPGLRKVQQLVSLARRGALNNQDDEPWSLATMEAEGIPWEAVPYLLGCLKDLGRSLTNRMARWLWRIHLAAPELDVYDASHEASRYASREMVSQYHDRPFVTGDLDARIAYKPWRSEEAMQAYLNAIERGYIPEPPSVVKRLSTVLMTTWMRCGQKPPPKL